MRTSLNISDELLAEFDEIWQEEGLDSRSRAAREAMELYIKTHTCLDQVEGKVVGLIALDYRHEKVISALHDIQHDFQDIITTTSHMHDEGWCLETIFCRGSAHRIRQFVYELRDFDGVRRVKLLVLRS